MKIISDGSPLYDSAKMEKSPVSHEGVFDFYKGRIESASNYGLKSGDEMLHVILRCAFWDSFLTDDEYNIIINLCDLAHKRILENNWKETWKDERDNE